MACRVAIVNDVVFLGKREKITGIEYDTASTDTILNWYVKPPKKITQGEWLSSVQTGSDEKGKISLTAFELHKMPRHSAKQPMVGPSLGIEPPGRQAVCINTVPARLHWPLIVSVSGKLPACVVAPLLR